MITTEGNASYYKGEPLSENGMPKADSNPDGRPAPNPQPSRGALLLNMLSAGDGKTLSDCARALLRVNLNCAEAYAAGMAQAGLWGWGALLLAVAVCSLDADVESANVYRAILETWDYKPWQKAQGSCRY